jgi:hypothetical protein
VPSRHQAQQGAFFCPGAAVPGKKFQSIPNDRSNEASSSRTPNALPNCSIDVISSEPEISVALIFSQPFSGLVGWDVNQSEVSSALFSLLKQSRVTHDERLWRLTVLPENPPE